MTFNELKYRALVGIFDIAGQFISSQLTKPSYEGQEKLASEYFEELKLMARKEEQRVEKERKQIGYKEPEPVEVIPVREKQEGTFCLPCSRDHFSTVSGALNEALRFARKEGIRHPEVMKRIGDSLDELNMLERIDLSAENMVQLSGKDKEIAEWGLEKSRMLRHKITQILTPENLESVAAEAASVRTEFMQSLWDIATVDGSIEKLCKGLKDEERERCISVINTVLEKRVPLETVDDIGS